VKCNDFRKFLINRKFPSIQYQTKPDVTVLVKDIKKTKILVKKRPRNKKQASECYEYSIVHVTVSTALQYVTNTAFFM
jgi:hypothetical protein